jgi:hypothetical protein
VSPGLQTHFVRHKELPLWGSGPMEEDRAYFVGRDGHFKKSVVLLCPDDEAAKERAKQLVDDCDIELWLLGRKVETFKHRLK